MDYNKKYREIEERINNANEDTRGIRMIGGSIISFVITFMFFFKSGMYSTIKEVGDRAVIIGIYVIFALICCVILAQLLSGIAEMLISSRNNSNPDTINKIITMSAIFKSIPLFAFATVFLVIAISLIRTGEMLTGLIIALMAFIPAALAISELIGAIRFILDSKSDSDDETLIAEKIEMSTTRITIILFGSVFVLVTIIAWINMFSGSIDPLAALLSCILITVFFGGIGIGLIIYGIKGKNL